MSTPREHILIVGGGTAGWLTAAWLARALGPAGVRVTLIESRDVATVGVGEGTFPTIAHTLAMLGADEAEFMRESSAAFKQGIRFVDWVHPRAAGRRRHYYHPFALPRTVEGIDLLPYWLNGEAGSHSLADAVTLQEKACDAGRAPKRVSDAAFRGPMNYAYHLDAGRFGAWLGGLARKLGVQHLEGTVLEVLRGQSGAVAGVVTREHGTLEADLYVDCTGFRSELLGRALNVPFHDMSHVLFVDRAVVMQVPYESDLAIVPPYTISTAHEAGWTWDIALPTRRGVGYVYSTRHTDGLAAERVLREYVGARAEHLPVRHLPLSIGWRTRQWEHNCVAVGLAGGFLEPLESTGIVLIEAAARMISELFPRAGDLAPAAARFNQLMTRRYERIADFIKLHYFLTRRTDTAFWRDNTAPESAPDSLRAHLEMWRHRPPSTLDFSMDHETFAPANYQFILYGMEFATDLRADAGRYNQRERARAEFARVQDAGRRAVAALPTHRELLQRVNQAGFSFPDAVPEAARPVLMR